MSAPPPMDPLPEESGRNGWAIAALVCGLCGGLLGIIFGVIALNKANEGRGGRRMAIVGIVLSIGWIVGAGVVYSLAQKAERSLTTAELRVGDCISQLPDGDLLRSVKLVGCDQPHVGETFALLPVIGDHYPGDREVAAIRNKCGAALRAYSPESYEGGTLEIMSVPPSSETWYQDERRVVTCIALTEAPAAGSIRR